MDSSTFNNALWEELKVKLMDVGRRLLRLPSSTDEILNLLEEAESILVGVWQGIPGSESGGPLYPLMAALVTDEIFRHADLNIQVAVASCFSELTRITAPTFPYADDQMKEIFQLFMVALKQLSTEYGKNLIRAHQILETLATVKSCLIMLDIEIEAVIVEMFQLFLDTVRSNHSSDIINYMETIMTIIIKECDEVSLELLKPLLDSVRKDNKEISPVTRELGKSIFEKCATKIKPCLREAVKQLNLKVDDYDEIVASICKATSKRQNMVSESDEVSEADHENFTPQMNDRNGLDNKNPMEISAEIVQQRNNYTSSDLKPVNGADTVQSQEGAGPHRMKRCRKPNSLLRPEEGYAHIWTRERQGSPSVSHDRNNKEKVVLGKRGRSNKEKRREKNGREIIPQKDESGDFADKIVESPLAPEKEETFNGSKVEYGEEMVNAKIKVWWPLDKTFYMGLVEAFDPLTKRHKIKYDDGEEEVLNLREERWELFNERPQQIQSSQK